MPTVSDTSSVSNLAMVGLLHILKELHGEVLIPDAVAAELQCMRHLGGRRAVDSAVAEGWLKTVTLKENPAPIFGLHPGETAAISLALSLPDTFLLMDEADGRKAAVGFGLKIGGVLGSLLGAKRKGLISSVGTAMEQLRAEARFFISPRLFDEVLLKAGENG